MLQAITPSMAFKRLRVAMSPLSLPVIEGVPAERTTAAPAAPEPLEQATAVEQIPTRAAPLVRQSPIASHNAVADCAFRLTLQCAFHIPFECRQCVDDTAVEDGDGAKACAKPGLPFLLVDCDTVDSLDARRCQRKRRWQRKAHRHGRFVYGIRSCDFMSTGRDLHAERFVGFERLGPVLNALQC